MCTGKPRNHPDDRTWTTLDRALPALAVLIVACNLLALYFWYRNKPAEEITAPEPFDTATSLQYIPPLLSSLPGPLSSLTPQLNGIPIDQIVVLPPDAINRVRQVYALGQSLGRDPRAFSKIGDSTIESPHFMDRFDGERYNLGEYAYLQSVIDHFAGSFSRQGMAVLRGLHSWTIFDPMWADAPDCQPAEGPVDCEIRLHNPAIVLIRLGANDVGRTDLFTRNMQELIQYCLERGVIPVIGTKADRNEGPENTNNQIMRQIAAEYHLPLWDFDKVAQTLPNNGMRPDGVHLAFFDSQDYTQPRALQIGYAIHNLTALMMLYEILRVLS